MTVVVDDPLAFSWLRVNSLVMLELVMTSYLFHLLLLVRLTGFLGVITVEKCLFRSSL